MSDVMARLGECILQAHGPIASRSGHVPVLAGKSLTGSVGCALVPHPTRPGHPEKNQAAASSW